MGLTRGYANHPQLARFRSAPDPLLAIGTYLYHVYLEGLRRGYRFSLGKMGEYDESASRLIPVPSGQVRYEYSLLLCKLSLRDPEWGRRLEGFESIEVNPVFYIVEAPVADWERPRPLPAPGGWSSGCLSPGGRREALSKPHKEKL